MIDKKIIFCATKKEMADVWPHPQPASRMIPNAYRKLERFTNKDLHRATVKTCMPFLDSMTAGYIIPFDQDYLVDPIEDDFSIAPASRESDDFGYHNKTQLPPEWHKYTGENAGKFHNKWLIKTNKLKEFRASSIIIAGGVGSFEPRKFTIKECEKFEGKEIFYSVKDKTIFKNKTVSIFGGGDSALDWAIELSANSKVQLIHRRDEFRGAQASVDKVKKLSTEGKIELLTQYQLSAIEGDNKIQNINIKHDNGTIKKIQTNYVLGFFGLIMQLGPIAEWGLNLDKKTIPVNTENFETNQKGIFAIGDICTYPGKLKLILSGFHEGALAARGCFKYARPKEKLKFEFTTTSKNVQSRLGVKKND